jgi:hypothetical protein
MNIVNWRTNSDSENHTQSSTLMFGAGHFHSTLVERYAHMVLFEIFRINQLLFLNSQLITTIIVNHEDRGCRQHQGLDRPAGIEADLASMGGPSFCPGIRLRLRHACDVTAVPRLPSLKRLSKLTGCTPIPTLRILPLQRAEVASPTATLEHRLHYCGMRAPGALLASSGKA